jgi:hypothetical protein
MVDGKPTPVDDLGISPWQSSTWWKIPWIVEICYVTMNEYLRRNIQKKDIIG